MAIDNSLDAAEKLIEADEREANPITQRLVNLAGELIPGTGTILDFLERHREENRDLLIGVLKNSLRGLLDRFDELETRHREFLKGEFMGLVLDGLKKAEDIRTRERVRYLAKILTNAAKEGPKLSPDRTEELMRLAAQLNGTDLRTLRHFRQMRPGVNGYPGGSAGPVVDDLQLWAEVEGASGSWDESVESACFKLQSMGLLGQYSVASRFASGSTPRFQILAKGIALLRIIIEA